MVDEKLLILEERILPTSASVYAAGGRALLWGWWGTRVTVSASCVRAGDGNGLP